MTSRCKADGTMAAFCVSAKHGPFIFSNRRAGLSPGVLMAIVKGKEIAVTDREQPRGAASGGMQVAKCLRRPERQLEIYEFVCARHHLRRKKKEEVPVQDSAK